MFPLLACGGDELVVQLHLCPGPPDGSADYQMLRRAAAWNIEVLGIEGENVTWRRTFAGTDPIASLEIAGAIPPEQELRFLIEGRGLDDAGHTRVVAMAASGALVLRGNENICLCIAPPDSYQDYCLSWQCTYNTTTGSCF